MAFWCECMSVCVRKRDLWACVRHTRDRLKNRSCSVSAQVTWKKKRCLWRCWRSWSAEKPSCGSGNQVHRGGVSMSLLPAASLFSMPNWRLHLAFANCAKLFGFFSSLENTGWCGRLWWELVSQFGGRLSWDRHASVITHTARQIPGRGATASMPVRQKGTFNHVYFHFSSFSISTKRDADASFCFWLNPTETPKFYLPALI